MRRSQGQRDASNAIQPRDIKVPLRSLPGTMRQQPPLGLPNRCRRAGLPVLHAAQSCQVGIAPQPVLRRCICHVDDDNFFRPQQDVVRIDLDMTKP